MFVLTSLESYYPEKLKLVHKDKKGPKEFATNIDQPKDPKAIKIKVSFDRSTNEITKELKSKLRVIMNPRGAMTQRGRTSVVTNTGGSGFLSARGGQSDLNRRVSQVPAGAQSGSGQGLHVGQGEESARDELRLYLFKTRAKSKMLAFKRLENSEFPLRLLAKTKME